MLRLNPESDGDIRCITSNWNSSWYQKIQLVFNNIEDTIDNPIQKPAYAQFIHVYNMDFLFGILCKLLSHFHLQYLINIIICGHSCKIPIILKCLRLEFSIYKIHGATSISPLELLLNSKPEQQKEWQQTVVQLIF